VDQNKKLREQLTQARKEGHFIFVPSVPLPQVNGLFIPVLEVVRLLPSDFYPNQGKFGIHHHASMKLADAAGIQWAAEVGRVGRMDDHKNPNYCSFRVVGRYRTAEGLWSEVVGHKHIDLDAKRSACEEKYKKQFFFKNQDFQTNKGKKPWPNNEQDYIRQYTDRDINQIRETMDERCESGAQSRVIRNILHLPVSFHAHGNNKNNHDGIAKDFYIVRYILDPANPQVQAAQLASFQQAITGVYGVAPGIIEGPPMPAAIPAKDVTPENLPPAAEGAMPESAIVDFENIPVEEQVRTIMTVIEKTGYRLHEQDMKGQPGLEFWNQEHRTEYYKHIMKGLKK